MQSHQFTLAEATDLLPWLESKFAELDPYRSELRAHRDQFEDLLRKSGGNGSRDTGEELHRLEQLLREMQKSVEDVLEQIGDRGILVRDPDRGLVDFPSVREGQEVHLCWIRGEPEIAHWHSVDEGYAGRQPL